MYIKLYIIYTCVPNAELCVGSLIAILAVKQHCYNFTPTLLAPSSHTRDMCVCVSLSSLAELDHGLSEPQIRCITHQMLLALECLHSKGCIHRDLKAGNLLLCSDGSIRLGGYILLCSMMGILWVFTCVRRTGTLHA